MPNITISETYQKWYQRMKDHGTGDAPFCIAFCGVFSSGKTSLINRLLHCDLPTGINPITKVVTRLRYGKRKACFFIVGGEKTPLPPQHLADVITGKRTIPEGCSEILIELPSEFLKQNVEIIDTPGYEDTQALEDMTRTAVLTADLILFCVSALVLGRQFEKEYLRELQQSHGNFCMVVNRVDNLNTDEDFEAVRALAQYLMRGRGSASQGEGVDGQCFFTIADGRYATLNGLDTFLNALIGSPAERKTIRDSTNRCFTAYNLDLLSDAMKNDLQEHRTFLAELEEKEAASLRYLQRDHQLQMMALKNKTEEYTIYVDLLLNSLKHSLAKKFEAFTAPRQFSANATAVLYEQLRPLQDKMAGYAHTLGMEKEQAAQLLSFDTALEIPAAVARQVVTRTATERIGNTLGRWFQGDFTIDDGCSWIWEDFHYYANEYVQTKVIKPLREKWELICQRLIDALAANEPTEGEYAEKIASLRELISLLVVLYNKYFTQMSPEPLYVCTYASEQIDYMLMLVQDYLPLVAKLSMPAAFVRMLTDHVNQLKSMQKEVQRRQTGDLPGVQELLEATFVSMCRAYVTLKKRPHNPDDAEDILTQMKLFLENVYGSVLGRGELDEKIIRESADKD